MRRMEMDEPHCERCKFCNVVTEVMGMPMKTYFECHRFPAAVRMGAVGSEYTHIFWPVISQEPFWCGEFKERSA